KFVPLLVADAFEPDGERLDLTVPRFGKQSDDQAGIQTAAEEDSHRYVGDQATRHRASHHVQREPLPAIEIELALLRSRPEVVRPVATLAARAVGLDHEQVRGRQL